MNGGIKRILVADDDRSALVLMKAACALPALR